MLLVRQQRAKYRAPSNSNKKHDLRRKGSESVASSTVKVVATANLNLHAAGAI